MAIDRYWFGCARFIGGTSFYADIYERVPLADTWALKWTSPTPIQSQDVWCVCLPDTRDGDYFGVLFGGNLPLSNPLRLYAGTFAGGMTLHELPSTIYGRGIYVGGPDNILVWAVAYPANRGTLYHWDGSTFSVVLDLGPQGYGPYGTFLDGQKGVVVCTPNSHSSSNPVYVNTDGDLGNPSSWVSIGVPVASRACNVFVTKVVSATEFEIHASPQTGDPWGPSGYRWYTPGGESWSGYSRFYAGGTSCSSKAYARRDADKVYAHLEYPQRVGRYDAGAWGDQYSVVAADSALRCGSHLADIDCTAFGGHYNVAIKSFIAERRWGVDSDWTEYVAAVFGGANDLRTAYKITTGDPPEVKPYATKVFTVDNDIIRVFFSDYVDVTKHYYDINTYIIMAIAEASCSIKSVRKAQGAPTNFVELSVSGLIDGEAYILLISPSKLRSTSGVFVRSTLVPWTHGVTKVEMTKSSLSGVYDVSLQSHLRTVLQAIMVSDEEIGGNQVNRIIEAPGLVE